MLSKGYKNALAFVFGAAFVVIAATVFLRAGGRDLIAQSLVEGGDSQIPMTASVVDGLATSSQKFIPVPSITALQVQKKYQDALATGQKVTILIVPGHEPKYGGAEYRSIKERDIVSDLAQNLVAYLSKDERLSVAVTRDKKAWSPFLAQYFEKEWEAIKTFRSEKNKQMRDLVSSGKVVVKKDNVPHVTVSPDVGVRLFGINKWANDNQADILIHIHFNDYPRRKWRSAGDYTGLTVYVPESQYPNSAASLELAKPVYAELTKFFPSSNYPPEKAGIVEDQTLVAVGSRNTLNAMSLLIEYGYMYEGGIVNPSVRPALLKEYASRTHKGIMHFLKGEASSPDDFSSTLLPYHWDDPIAYGSRDSRALFSLQAALIREGVYPPPGMTKNDCGIDGNFGPCTKESLIAFQQKYALSSEAGTLGPKTRAKLNNLYSKH